MTWIAALLLAAAAQDPSPAGPETGPRRDPAQEPFFSLSAEGKLSLISGEVVPSRTEFFFIVPIEIRGTDYEDVFSNGTGFCLEATLTWERPHRQNPTVWQLGGYLRVAYDSFDGDRHSDDFGNFFAPRDWEITTALVGFRGGIRSDEGLFVEGRVGLGVVYYGAVQAEFAFGGGPPATGEFLAAGVGVASELGLKVGYRSERVEFSLGLNGEFQAGPQRGRDMSDVVKPAPVTMVSFTLGLGVRF